MFRITILKKNNKCFKTVQSRYLVDVVSTITDTDSASKLVENQVYTSIFGRCVYSMCLYHSATFEMTFTMTFSICGLYFVHVDGEVNLKERRINQK